MKKADKIVGIIFLIIFILVLILSLAGRRSGPVINPSSPGIGLLYLRGIIVDSENFCRRLKKFRKEDAVRGIVIRVDSPGGVVAASQEIYQGVKRAKESKPVVISMGSVAASGAYYVSIGGDSIYANPGTLTGSIGVIMDYPVLTELLDKIGIGIATYKTGQFKDTGSPYRVPTMADSAYLMSTMNDIYEQFVNAIVEERGISKNQLLNISDGRIFTGLQARELGLIDRIGTLEDAIKCAARMAGISEEPRIIRLPEEKNPLLRIIFDSDLSGLFKQISQERLPEYRWK